MWKISMTLAFVLLGTTGCCSDKPPTDLEIAITSPADGGTVCREDRVEGTTSGGGHTIYVLVHPLRTDTWWVQNLPAPLPSWKSVAFFGTPNKGVGEEFEIIAFATCQRLKAGQTLTADEFPKDAVFSNSVTVTRNC